MQPKGLPLTLYFDQQFAPGSAINREAWMLMKLGETQHYLKAGTLMLPFGYRIEDDTSFVRTMSRKNFDSNDTGMELGLEYSTFTVNFAVSNGSTSSSNPDNKLSYASRVEWLGNNIRAGVSALTNTTEQVGVKNETQMFALFAGANVFGFNLLFEVDQVNEESQGQDVSQLATLAEINREIAKGYNIKFTTEWWDPDTDIDNDHRTRNSLLLEATPYASLQVRGGLRIGEDIPQRTSGNYEQLFLQFHFYY